MSSSSSNSSCASDFDESEEPRDQSAADSTPAEQHRDWPNTQFPAVGDLDVDDDDDDEAEEDVAAGPLGFHWPADGEDAGASDWLNDPTVTNEFFETPDETLSKPPLTEEESTRPAHTRSSSRTATSSKASDIRPTRSSARTRRPTAAAAAAASATPVKSSKTAAKASSSSSRARARPTCIVKSTRAPQRLYYKEAGAVSASARGRVPLTTNVARQVVMLEPITMAQLGVFKSCSDAARDTGINRTKLSRTCRGGGGIINNLYFRYIDAPSTSTSSVTPAIAQSSSSPSTVPPEPVSSSDATRTDDHFTVPSSSIKSSPTFSNNEGERRNKDKTNNLGVMTHRGDTKTTVNAAATTSDATNFHGTPTTHVSDPAPYRRSPHSRQSSPLPTHPHAFNYTHRPRPLPSNTTYHQRYSDVFHPQYDSFIPPPPSIAAPRSYRPEATEEPTWGPPPPTSHSSPFHGQLPPQQRSLTPSETDVTLPEPEFVPLVPPSSETKGMGANSNDPSDPLSSWTRRVEPQGGTYYYNRNASDGTSYEPPTARGLSVVTPAHHDRNMSYSPHYSRPETAFRESSVGNQFHGTSSRVEKHYPHSSRWTTPQSSINSSGIRYHEKGDNLQTEEVTPDHVMVVSNENHQDDRMPMDVSSASPFPSTHHHDFMYRH